MSKIIATLKDNNFLMRFRVLPSNLSFSFSSLALLSSGEVGHLCGSDFSFFVSTIFVAPASLPVTYLKIKAFGKTWK